LKTHKKMTTDFCPACGSRLQNQTIGDRRRLYCNRCQRIQYRNPIVGVAVLILQWPRILLVQRNRSYAGAWCIPCGYVEWNEDVRRAAGRELKEETGLEADIGPVFDVHSNFHDPDNQTVGIWFWGRPTGGRLLAGSDAADLGYFPIDRLPEPMAFPTDLLVCRQLREYLHPNGGHAGSPQLSLANFFKPSGKPAA
jgi:ADP-ribose pyrophosphatase YjhB (NUDIX family)